MSAVTMKSYDLDTAEGKADRRNYVGASEVGTVLGLNPRKSPYMLALEKRGILEPDDLSENKRVQWGKRLEDAIRRGYAEDQGARVRQRHIVFVHPQYDFFRAHVDGEILGDPRGVGLLECKNVDKDIARFGGWGEELTDEIPPIYISQNQAGMLLTGYKWGELYALMGGNEPRIYPFVADPEYQQIILARVKEFWACVTSGNLDSLSRTVEDMTKIYPTSTGVDVEATDDIAAALGTFVLLDAQAKDKEAQAKVIKAKIQGHMREADTLIYKGEKVATWRSQTTKAHSVAEFSYRKFVPVKAKGN
jgi:putative phage-type endonuclease